MCSWRTRLGAPGRHGDMPWTATGQYMLSSKHIELRLRLQTQLTTALGRIRTLEAREPTRTDDLVNAGSSS
ncbi:hypothetical protein Tco_1008977 [Tanacetum coccineum]